jgi:hypothetical protein
MRSGTTLINRDVCEKIIGIRPKAEISPLSEVISCASRFNEDYEFTRKQDWLPNSGLRDRLIALSLDYLLPSNASMSWQVGKDPNLVKFPKILTNLVTNKDLKLLLLVRDPLDVITSALAVQSRQKFGHSKKFYIDEVFESYLGLIELIESDHNSQDVYILYYEEYVQEPENHLKLISKWLGLEATLKPSRPKTEFDQEDPYYSKLIEEPVSTESVNNFQVNLTLIERHYLGYVFSGVRQKLGYQKFPVNRFYYHLGRLKFRFVG